MKTATLYGLVACLAFSFMSCYKTYNCKCDTTGITVGQVKATSKTKALDRCTKNCSSNSAKSIYYQPSVD